MPQHNQSCRLRFINGYRRLFLVLPIVAVLLLVSGIGASAQTVIKAWTMGAESNTQMEVSYRIVKCTPTSDAELHLQIFNEKPTAEVAKFDVVITDVASNQSFTTRVNKSMALAEMITADCGSNTALSNLKIAIPTNYDPAALTVTITFIP